METILTCPKCAGAMEEGFLPDQSEGFYVPHWQPGSPEPVRFLGGNVGTFKVNKDQWRPVITYRCTQCGFLESYAP